MRVPKAIQNLIEGFERLPGIGPKTAQRLAFYLLHVPQAELDRFAGALTNLKKNTLLCSVCFAVDESDPCFICSDKARDRKVICVVEQPLDVMAMERSGRYTGLYHILHGRIDPLSNIGPDEIHIDELLGRIKNNLEIAEIILATNPTMEGEATAMYIARRLGSLKSEVTSLGSLRVTRIGRGLPTGADLEYADPMTLTRALEGRMGY